GYYLKMAVAWGLSMAYLQQKQPVLALLQGDALCTFTHNKTVSKLVDSFRVSPEEKAALKKLRRR
ncbi:MAG: DNA alkylation repair protein, partial [Christensenellaceae bacterium]|nr:DNA alkylation repair protein [Christensenellaceae bacterium]